MRKALCVLFGVLFLGAALAKMAVFGIGHFAEFLTAAGIPFAMANAIVVVAVETGCGACLLLSPWVPGAAKLSRWAALPLAGDMVVAIATVGIRAQMGHPVTVGGHVVAGEPWRLALEVVCLVATLFIAATAEPRTSAGATPQ
ncbi:MAG: DoxX family protein [Candidatus Xenobia bacterium]